VARLPENVLFAGKREDPVNTLRWTILWTPNAWYKGYESSEMNGNYERGRANQTLLFLSLYLKRSRLWGANAAPENERF
jgi:hypothetical protein